MRNHVTALRDAATLRRGDHVAWFGDGPGALHALARDLFAAGAEHGERMFYVAGEDDFAALADLPGLDRLQADDRLRFVPVDEVYRAAHDVDVEAQLATFTALVDEAIADGWAGIRVLADNTSLVEATDEQVTSWLRWEHIADRFQSARPVLGVCFFDALRIPPDRLAALAGTHPVTTAPAGAPPFRWFYDGDVARLTGEVDVFSIAPLRRVLATAPPVPELTVDLSQSEFVDHHTLLALADLAGPQRTVRVRNAPPYLPTVRDILELDSPHLHITTG